MPKQKRPTHSSVDGFLPQRPRHVSRPEYYRQSNPISGGPRRSIASRRQPIDPEKNASEDPVEQASHLGNFAQPETNIFQDTSLDDTPEQTKKGRKDKSKKQPGKLRSWWKRRSFKFKFAFISSLILLIIGGLAGYRLYGFLNSVFGRGVGNSSSAALNDQVRPDQLNTEGDGRLNVLLLGRGGTENEAPDLTDTILIASIDLQNQSTSLLSIARDTYVGSASDNSKINGVFSRAKETALYKGKTNDQAEDDGIKAAIAAVRNVSGVPIHKYVLTDYKAFRDVVNALGGVDVTVPDAIYDGFTGWSFKAGPQTMNGDRALQYARTRHGSARGDFDRTENQRRLLVAMRKKATSTGIVANPIRLNSLANAVQKNIRTDLTVDEAKTVFSKTKQMQDASIKSLDLDDPTAPLVTTGMVNGQSIVRPLAGIQDYTDIRAFARTNMMDPFLKKEAPTVAVYNGTSTAGLATLVGNVMSGYGYKILEKDTSKKPQTKTLIIKVNKAAKKPFTERFLTVRFGTTIMTNLPGDILPTTTKISTTPPAKTSNGTMSTSPPVPDYIVVLGSNFDTTPSGPTW